MYLGDSHQSLTIRDHIHCICEESIKTKAARREEKNRDRTDPKQKSIVCEDQPNTITTDKKWDKDGNDVDHAGSSEKRSDERSDSIDYDVHGVIPFLVVSVCVIA